MLAPVDRAVTPESPSLRVDAAAESATEARPSWRVLALLSALMGFASISTDLYLPAMPTMGQSLGARAGLMEFSISGFLIGFCLGQLVWGPISDRFGRRLPIATGLVLFILGSAGCAIADSATAMIGWRILQALGACASVALGRSMVRDLYAGSRAAQMLSTLMTVMAIAPLVGPLVGGQILALAGWRAIFWTLVGVGLVTLAALFTVPETLPPAQRNREPLAGALLQYGRLLRSRRLLGYVGTGAFFYGGVFAYIAGSPFAFITYHHLPASLYGVLFGAGIVGIMATNALNARLVRSLGIERLLVAGTVIALAAGIATAMAGWTGIGGLTGLVVPLFVFVAMNGLIVANSITGALAGFPERAGAVSALTGAIQYGCGILGSALVGSFADGTPWPLGWVIALAGIGSFASLRLLGRPDSGS